MAAVIQSEWMWCQLLLLLLPLQQQIDQAREIRPPPEAGASG